MSYLGRIKHLHRGDIAAGRFLDPSVNDRVA